MDINNANVAIDFLPMQWTDRRVMGREEEEEPVQQGHFQGKAHSLSSTSDKSKTDREKRLQYFGI